MARTFVCHSQNNTPNPITTTTDLTILPETMNKINFLNSNFLAPAEIKIKSPITGIHEAKNIAPYPNLSNIL